MIAIPTLTVQATFVRLCIQPSCHCWLDGSINILISHQDLCSIKVFVCLAQGASQQACGHMYLDQGEELDLGTSRDHMLAFSAFTARTNAPTVGQVMLHLYLIRTGLFPSQPFWVAGECNQVCMRSLRLVPLTCIALQW